MKLIHVNVSCPFSHYEGYQDLDGEQVGMEDFFCRADNRRKRNWMELGM